MKDVLLIVTGWLLGFAGTFLMDRIRDAWQARAFKKTLSLELKDIGVRFALTFANITMRRGTLDREGLNWVNSKLLGYDGLILEGDLKELLIKMSGWSDSDLARGLGHLRKPEEIRSAARKYAIVSLQAGVDKLLFLAPVLARKTLDIVRQINDYNALVDDWQTFLNRTFDPISSENYQIASDNLSKAEVMLASSAKRIADRIEAVEELC